MKLFQACFFLVLEIFLSLTTTCVAVPKYAKTGCKDTCGNVRIPFPFGIGANCYVNEWYNVDCNSSTPYLSSFNQLEVLGVDLENRTVTVKMQKFSNCNQTTKSVNLYSSPFLYSKSQNTFVYEGYCGNAVMMDNHGSVLTGCSTTCSNGTTTTGILDTSNCLGINCCQRKIPQYMESYSMNVTGMGGDGVCGSAYLMDINSNQSARDGTSYIPTSLRWTLSNHDREQASCSSGWEQAVMNLGNGTTMMDSWVCYGGSGIKGNPYLIDGYGTSSLKYTKPGCKDTCGNDVVISYPFGIGASCSLNEWYTVYCNSSKPYLAKLDRLQLVGVDLENQTVTVNMPKFSDCNQPIKSMDLGSSPFLYSKTHNKLIYEGYCGNAVMMDDGGSALTGCSTTCNNDTTNTTVIIDANKCFGISCCQTTISRYLKSYKMNLTGLESRLGRDGDCGWAFLVDQSLYDKGSFSRQSLGAEGISSYVSTTLLWTLSDRDKHQFTCCNPYGERGREPSSFKVDLGNGASLDTWRCYYYETGNPYLVDGCGVRVDPEYDEPLDPEECTRCIKRGGYCYNQPIYDIDGLVYQDNYICYGASKISMGVILGVGISMGLLFLVAMAYILYKVIKKTKEKRRRKRFFKRNGGFVGHQTLCKHRIYAGSKKNICTKNQLTS